MLLKNLSANNKIELITRLSKSLTVDTTSVDNSWKSLYGAFIMEQFAPDFANELKKERKFVRKPIEL